MHGCIQKNRETIHDSDLNNKLLEIWMLVSNIFMDIILSQFSFKIVKVFTHFFFLKHEYMTH